MMWSFVVLALGSILPSSSAASPDSFERTRERAAKIRDDIVGWRRHLHAHPELMYQEHLTSQFIQDVLQRLKIPFTAGWGKNTRQSTTGSARPVLGPGGTGVVAEIGQGQPVVALRADMDALPILEETPVAYRSQTPGQMHACGHDGHTSMLLGAAKLLKDMKLPGTVRLIFQPAEEGGAGAKRMLEEGVLNGVSRIFGLHLFPSLPSGAIGGRPGTTMAAADFFDFSVRGRGAHAAMPQMGVDPVTAAAAVIQSLQSIVSRETDPLSASVVSVTKVTCGDAYNVIPSSCSVGGTIRSLSSQGLDALRERVMDVSRQVAQAHRCVLENATFMADSFPPTENDPELWTWLAESGLKEGFPSMLWDLPPTMGGEDFAFFAQKIPAAFIFLGQGSKLDQTMTILDTDETSTYREQVYVPTNVSLHSPMFHMDEDVLELGSALHTHMAAASLHAMASSTQVQ